MRRMMLAALLVVGCGGVEDLGPPPEIELGTGLAEFQPLADGDEILIVQGPQGGYHFDGALRATNVTGGNPQQLDDPDNPFVAFRVFRGETRIDNASSEFYQGLEPVPGTAQYELLARRIILDIDDDDELAGSDVILEVELRDVTERSASDRHTLRAVPHPNNL